MHFNLNSITCDRHSEIVHVVDDIKLAAIMSPHAQHAQVGAMFFITSVTTGGRLSITSTYAENVIRNDLAQTYLSAAVGILRDVI